jgi:hypothetical protein
MITIPEEIRAHLKRLSRMPGPTFPRRLERTQKATFEVNYRQLKQVFFYEHLLSL